jgi:sulfatase maturation enzyme AslB (radical SAM superfamily)
MNHLIHEQNLDNELKNLSIMYIFIYLTEKCNFDCDYCYFKDKRGRTLSFSTIESFLKFLYNRLTVHPRNFIISGGESLIFWPLVKRTVKHIRRNFRESAISIQTNGFLLDVEKISFFKENIINLEIGIDGDFYTTSAHRKGVTRQIFKNLICNINECASKNIFVTCTMTVHPDQVNRLYDNFIFLSKLGLEKIDVTPAAFMAWNKSKTEVFKREYIRIIKDARNLRKLYIKEESLDVKRLFLDLSLHPPGYVFCGDTYLCLPEKVREQYTIFTFNKKINFRKNMLSLYFKKYKDNFDNFKGKITYIDYISTGFKIINEIVDSSYLNSRQMIEFHDFLKRAHRAIIFKNYFS